MKKLLLFLVLLAATTVAAQNKPYILDTPGTVAKYRSTDAKGRVVSFRTVTVLEVDKTDDRNFTVTVSQQDFDKNNAPKAQPVKIVYPVRNGVVDLSGDLTSEFASEKAVVTLSGQLPSLPSDARPGDVTTFDITIDVSLNERSMKMYATGTERFVAQEKLTTPAGDFDCLRSDVSMSMKVLGIKATVGGAAWYAAGIGEVRTDLHSKSGKLKEVEELISLSR